MWDTGNFGMISLSFAIWLALGGLAVVWVRFTSARLSAYDRHAGRFWVSYAVVLVVVGLTVGIPLGAGAPTDAVTWWATAAHLFALTILTAVTFRD